MRLHLISRPLLWLLVLSAATGATAQVEPLDSVGQVDVDFLFNYYDQDGDHSPVTGGIGTEDLQVVSPVVVVNWRQSEKWDLRAEFGVDGITSASTDNIDLVSGASRKDNRAYTVLTTSRQQGTQTFGFTLGFSNEYDYRSFRAGVSWSKDLLQENVSLLASVQHYSDTVTLYGIDGVNRGEDDRTTTDLTLSASQVFGPRTWGSGEIFISSQSGFLSTPFHEVILAPLPEDLEGERVAERLPDERLRTAVGLRLNHSVTPSYVQRVAYRFYDDDWGIRAHSIELEPHFRLSTRSDAWIFPIFRFHTQTAADYYAPPETFSAADPYLTADGDLGEFDSQRYGLGYRIQMPSRSGWLGNLRAFETRLTSYSRDDGLEATSASLALSWRF